MPGIKKLFLILIPLIVASAAILALAASKPKPETVPAPAATPLAASATPMPKVEKAMFDDFNYTGPNDPNLTSFNWTVRTGTGGPGQKGCTWSPDNISFVDDPDSAGNRLLRLTATTNGTGQGTHQAEIYKPRKYFEGTYAARVGFTDVPFSGGPGGDEIVETFYSMSLLKNDNDPDYSECDFEYLPNGGWKVIGPTMWMTTWETYSLHPFAKNNTYNYAPGSLAGWHTIIYTISGGEVRYYIDGILNATHGGSYYPESMMSINFNLWFDGEGVKSSRTARSYVEDVDWVYHAKDIELTPTQVDALVKDYRTKSIKRIDNVN